MMKHTLPVSLLLLVSAPLAWAGPRDAAAVLSHCGRPMHGDEIILEDTVAGGRRLLKYERAVLTFDRMPHDGWTFRSGQKGQRTGLSAADLASSMPCLNDALIDSTSPGPIREMTSLNRVQVSLKRSLTDVILGSVILLALAGGVLFWLSKRPQNEEGLVG